jgi:hypothetical protein
MLLAYSDWKKETDNPNAGLLDYFMSLGGAAKWFAEMMRGLGELMSTIWDNMSESFSSALGDFLPDLRALGTAVVQVLAVVGIAVGGLLMLVALVLEGIVWLIVKVIEWVGRFSRFMSQSDEDQIADMKEMFSGIGDWLAKTGAKIRASLMSTWDSFLKWFREHTTGKLTEWERAVLNFFSGLGDRIRDPIVEAFQKVWDAVGEGLKNTVIDAVENIPGAIKDKIKQYAPIAAGAALAVAGLPVPASLLVPGAPEKPKTEQAALQHPFLAQPEIEPRATPRSPFLVPDRTPLFPQRSAMPMHLVENQISHRMLDTSQTNSNNTDITAHITVASPDEAAQTVSSLRTKNDQRRQLIQRNLQSPVF